MSVRSRLMAALLGIVACFAVSLGVQVWASHVRARRLDELRAAMDRERLIASIKRRAGDVQKQITLVAGIYGDAPTSGVSREERDALERQLVAIRNDLERARRLAGVTEPSSQRRFRTSFEDLARSWMVVYRELGVDSGAAIAELSIRAEPLSAALFHEHLPQWEQFEQRRVEQMTANMQATSRMTNWLTAFIFTGSAFVALIIVLRIGRYLVRINEELEARVSERTGALEQEVADRRRTEQALRESEERYAIAARGANDGLWDWDLRKQTIYISPRWKAMLGYGDSELGDSPDEWLARVHPDDRDQLESDLRAHLTRSTTHFENEHRLMHRDGDYRWMLTRGLAVFDENGLATRLAGSQTDIHARKAAEARLLHDALHDSLTGLANRALLLDRLAWTLARMRRHPDDGFAVLFLDLDRFKLINDSLGHVIGDQLLVGVARRLEACVRPGDTVARLGGDEFTLLLDELTSTGDAEAVAMRIHVALSVPFNVGGHDVYASASIGIAFSGRDYSRPEDLLRDADAAMYRAKSLGRARHEVFDSAMHSRALHRLQIETALWRALERDELFVEYQPIVSLRDGRVASIEALARWKRNDQIVQPAEFIPIAEEIGVISAIGRFVLRTALRDLAEWQLLFPANPLMLSVNVSPRQFADRDLVEKTHEEILRAGVAPHSVLLEITEGVLIDNPDAALSLLRNFRAADIRLCLDDFGTGYSSLNTLHRYPIDMIKIDQSFVAQMGREGERPEFVRAILTLARSLGVSVTAEGVETEEQASRLQSMDCEYAQGFIFSRPLAASAIPRFLAARCGPLEGREVRPLASRPIVP